MKKDYLENCKKLYDTGKTLREDETIKILKKMLFFLNQSDITGHLISVDNDRRLSLIEN